MRRYSILVLAFALSIGVAPALAQEFKAGDIVIEKPWARATPKGAEVGGAYLTIENKGATPDRLTGGSADFATVEIHEMKSENGVSEMRAVTGGLNIPAHGSVGLAPGGYHLMLTHLAHPLKKATPSRRRSPSSTPAQSRSSSTCSASGPPGPAA